MRTLIIGYGNFDRQDDGLAWHVLKEVRKLLDMDAPESVPEYVDRDGDTVFVFKLQLLPEDAEEIARFERVCFVDAHTGAVPEPVHVEQLLATWQHSPLTHHLTPNSLLSMIQAVYGKSLAAILVSVRGYEFEFTNSLSDRSALLVPQAANIIYNWIREAHSSN